MDQREAATQKLLKVKAQLAAVRSLDKSRPEGDHENNHDILLHEDAANEKPWESSEESDEEEPTAEELQEEPKSYLESAMEGVTNAVMNVAAVLIEPLKRHKEDSGSEDDLTGPVELSEEEKEARRIRNNKLRGRGGSGEFVEVKAHNPSGNHLSQEIRTDAAAKGLNDTPTLS